jgi:hypothetical protein
MRRTLVVCLVLFLITGCSSYGGSGRISISEDVIGSVQDTKVLVGIADDSLGEDPNFRTPYQAGKHPVYNQASYLAAMFTDLIFTIRESNQLSRESELIPFREALGDYDAAPLLLESLKKELESVSWLKVKGFELTRGYVTPEMKGLFESYAENSLLIVNVRYSLSADLHGLLVTCRAELFFNDEALKSVDPDKMVFTRPTLYRNEFTYIHSASPVFKTKEDAVTAWTANKGESIRNVLSEGIPEIAKMIRMDAKPVSLKSNDAQKEILTYHSISGSVVSENNKRVVLRVESGELFSVAK